MANMRRTYEGIGIYVDDECSTYLFRVNLGAKMIWNLNYETYIRRNR